MKCAALIAVVAASLSLATARCPDPKLQEAVVGGNTTKGGVILHKKPLRFAKVGVYSSSGETAWIGKTDKNGSFNTAQLPPGDYRLRVHGWGSTTIHLNAETHKPFGQTPDWTIFLSDNGCVGVMEVVN